MQDLVQVEISNGVIHNTVRHQVVALERPFSNYTVDKPPTVLHSSRGIKQIEVIVNH